MNERLDRVTEEIIGYSIPVSLWSKDKKPTKEEKEFASCLKFIEKSCNEKLEEFYGPEVSNSLGKLIYYPNNDKKRPPMLYAKLIYSEKSDEILSIFRVKGNQDPDPLVFLNKYCTVKMALIIESIFISDSVVSIQVKVHEVYVKSQKQKERQSLLTIPEESEEEDED